MIASLERPTLTFHTKKVAIFRDNGVVRCCDHKENRNAGWKKALCFAPNHKDDEFFVFSRPSSLDGVGEDVVLVVRRSRDNETAQKGVVRAPFLRMSRDTSPEIPD